MWLPFGYMCLQELGRKYDETGVTDAISKYDEWVKAQTFNPKDIMASVSSVEATVDGWNNVAGQSPGYMGGIGSGLDCTRNPLLGQRGLEDVAFFTSQGDMPYTVSTLLEKIDSTRSTVLVVLK